MVATRTRVYYSPDPLSVLSPQYHEVSHLLESAEWWSGKEKELDGVQAGGCNLTLDNEDRVWELGFEQPQEFTASGNEVTDAERALGVSGDNRPFRDLEFWAHYAAGADGTVPAWTATGSVLQGKAGAAARQFTYVTDSVLGKRVLRIEVADGDKFGTSTGERAEVYRQFPQGGFGCGAVEGQTVAWGLSILLEGDFEFNDAWDIFHQLHANDTLFGQAPYRLQIDANERWEWSIDSGAFASDTDALAGEDAGFNEDILMMDAELEQWFDFQSLADYTTDGTGSVVFEMRKRGGPWVRFAELKNVQTLPTYPGQTDDTIIYDKQGYYRGDAGTTPTVHVRYSDYWVGHSFADNPLNDEPVRDSSVGVYPLTQNLIENTDAKTNTTGATTAGGGTRTVTRVTDHGIRGTAFKLESQGDAGGQGIFFRKLDGTRIPASAGDEVMLACFIEGDAADGLGETVRVGLEWNNSGGSVISTTFAIARPTTADPRMHLLFATAPANTASLRVRTSWSGSTNGTFYVSGLTLSITPYLPPLIPVDNVAGGDDRAAGRIEGPAAMLDETAFWFAIRMRLEHDYGQHDFYPLLWGDDGNNLIGLQFDGTQWVVKRLNGGSGAPLNVPAKAWKRGEFVTVIVCGTASQLKMSEDGDPFTSAAHSTIPTLTATEFDLASGGTISSGQELAGDVMWAAFGTGYELTDADAATLAAFTDADPFPAQLRTMGVTGVWSADEAEAASGRFVDKWTRFKIVTETDNESNEEGTFYLTEPRLNWRGKSKHSLVQMVCVDGVGLQASQNLPRMDPPEATSYKEVVAYDEPWGQWGFDEREGTRLVSHSRRKRKRRKHETRRHYRRHGFRRWQSRETRAEVEGEAGPGGTYKHTPTLGEAPLIVGDEGRAVTFTREQDEWAKIVLDDTSALVEARALTVEAWVKPKSLDLASFVYGPENSGGGATGPVFALGMGSGPVYTFGILIDPSALSVNSVTVPAVGVAVHLVGTWDGRFLRIYINGVLEGEVPASGVLDSADANGFIGIAGTGVGTGVSATVDEGALYEKALSAERVLAHFEAGTERGRNQETTGARIAALSAHDLWDTSLVQTTGPQVQPIFMFGQSPLDEIDAAVECEMPDAHYFFVGDGVNGQPVYLSGRYRDAAPYNEVAAFLSDDASDAGSVRYDDSNVDWDNEHYNVVPTSIDGGTEHLATDEDDRARKFDHVFTGGTGLLLADDDDAEALGERILRRYSGPPIVRPFSVILNSSDEDQRPHAILRGIGDMVRFKRRGVVGDPVDVLTTILGYRKVYAGTKLAVTWNLARSIADLNDGGWHMGVEGFSEIGQTTVLG